MTPYRWDFTFVLGYAPLLLTGLVNTVKLAAVAFLCGLVVGLVVGIGQTAKPRPLRFLAACYVETFRNMPSIILLVWFFYAIPAATGWQSSIWLAASVSLSLYSGAYCAEIYRAGIESIERGQWEAARALGFGRLGQLRYIVLPQAVPRMIPAFTNRAIELVKATTLAGTLTYGELLYQAKVLAETEYRPLEAYTVVALIFTALLLPVSYFALRLERWARIAGTPR